MRKTEFAIGEYYHIYNRGVDKREIFSDSQDYFWFLSGLEEFNDEKITKSLGGKIREKKKRSLAPETKPLVTIIAYCLNPNHYHLILKEEKEKGITRFMHRLGTSYTNYFNQKYQRSGSLFQGPFQAVHIDSDEYLLYLSAYVNHNHFIHGCSKDKKEIYPYSSLPDYLKQRKQNFIKPEIIAQEFKKPEEYLKFSQAQALYMQKNKERGEYTLEQELSS